MKLTTIFTQAISKIGLDITRAVNVTDFKIMDSHIYGILQKIT